MDYIPREAYLSSMTGRTKWTRPMLQLLIDLGQSGATPHQMFARLRAMYGKPRWVGEVVAEYAHLRTGTSICLLAHPLCIFVLAWASAEDG